jgi:hypothetical protein
VAAPTLVDHTRRAYVIYFSREVWRRASSYAPTKLCSATASASGANAPPASHLSLIRSQ